MADIQLYDATLRDGMGGGGMSLTAEEKVRVVHSLDALGVHLIEAGFPASNPKEQQLFELLAQEELKVAQVVAFGMTRRRDVTADADEGLRLLADSFAPACTLVGKASVLHVEKVVRVSREENLQMISDSVAFLVGAGKRVLLDAEHFFDGFTLDVGYSLDCLRAAADAGAERVVLCDTNGGSLPPQIRTAFAVVREALPLLELGIHAHDDSGCGVANTLAAVEAGATQVQGTVNGIGERTGNANLITIIADLQLKMGCELLAPDQLGRLTETAHFVDELLNRSPNPAQPYVGKHAFAHKAGLHAAGVRADAQTFEHVEPAVVGNRRDVLISELSGKGTIVEKAGEAGIKPGDGEAGEAFAQRVVERVKELEHKGFQFEGAEGSFEMLVRRSAPDYQPPFELLGFTVVVGETNGGGVGAQAMVKLRVHGEVVHTAAEGAGPKGLLPHYPELADVHLVDYKVRIVDEHLGTAAKPRVVLESARGSERWSTVGCSENIIEASWQALRDSLELPLLRAGA
jgi:2-isopropylmalate synthase